MKLIAQLTLLPTPDQAAALQHTLATANAACDEISCVALEQPTFGKYDVQQMVYQRIKADYGLSAQMVIRCLSKVGDSYKLDRTVQRRFRRHGSIAYDDRILSFNLDAQTVSIWTVAEEHRQTIRFVWSTPAPIVTAPPGRKRSGMAQGKVLPPRHVRRGRTDTRTGGWRIGRGSGDHQPSNG